MNTGNFYVQPLGLLRGCSDFETSFRRVAGCGLYFSALKIIRRLGAEVSCEIVSVVEWECYLEKQPDTEARELRKLLQNIERVRPAIEFQNGLNLNWDRPVLQGVLNVTPDSFSDGGSFDDVEKSLSHAKQMLSSGADIIDVGGETTKPGAVTVSEGMEEERVLPVIKKLKALNCLISIDSRKPGVMRAALGAGAQIINDVSALEYDPESIHVAKDAEVPVILMHAQGTPENMQDDPTYDHAVLDIYDYLKARIDHCVTAGIRKENIIVDPGIGFGKTVDHNLQILANISLFHSLGVPLLIGVSRKSFIGKITGETEPDKRVSGSIAAAQHCIEQGVQIVRVHDVEETRKAISVYRSIIRQTDTI